MKLRDDKKRIALLRDLYKKLRKKMKLTDGKELIDLIIFWCLCRELDEKSEIGPEVKKILEIGEILEMSDSMQKNQKKKVTKSEYINFVNANVRAGKAGNRYFRAIEQLDEKISKQISEQIFDTYSLDQLKNMYGRLLKNGDLHDFNVNTSNSAPSAAISKLIDFYRIIRIFRVMEGRNELNLDSIRKRHAAAETPKT